MQKEQGDDFERVVREEKEKNSILRKNYEQQIEELKRAHFKQCDELGKQILKVTLEADRLHNQLVDSPRKTKIFEARSWTRVGGRLIIASIVIPVGRAMHSRDRPVRLCKSHSHEHRFMEY